MNDWVYIKNDEEIKKILDFFFDACLKEIRYESGAYVSDDFNMQPVNTKRNLYVIFQRQHKNPSSIEMVFEGLEQLNLLPSNNNYDCIINGAYMCFEKDKIVWFSSNYYDKDYKQLYDSCTWIKSCKAKYRITDKYLGENNIYINVKD